MSGGEGGVDSQLQIAADVLVCEAVQNDRARAREARNVAGNLMLGSTGDKGVHTRCSQVIRQMPQQQQRGSVCPLRVLDDQHKSAFSGRLDQVGCHQPKELIAPEIDFALGASKPAAQLGPSRRMARSRAPLKGAHPGPVRRRGIRLKASATSYGDPTALGFGEVLLDKGRFPDPGLAGDHGQPAMAANSFIERIPQCCELGLSAHEEPAGGRSLGVHRLLGVAA